MVREVEAALDAGAIGLSTGLIYAPGMHAPTSEIETLVAATARRGGLYATHMRNENDGLFAALDEAVAMIRAAFGGALSPVAANDGRADGRLLAVRRGLLPEKWKAHALHG
jgi:N-acyl-D-aspartate/D-glutamate deacylase